MTRTRLLGFQLLLHGIWALLWIVPLVLVILIERAVEWLADRIEDIAMIDRMKRLDTEGKTRLRRTP